MGIGLVKNNATPGLGDRLQAYKSPDWAGRTEWGNRNRDKFIKGMKYFDQVLRTQPYVAGEHFSMADITVLAALMHGGFAQIPIPDECTALSAWRQKVEARPSVKNRSGQKLELPASA